MTELAGAYGGIRGVTPANRKLSTWGMWIKKGL